MKIKVPFNQIATIQDNDGTSRTTMYVDVTRVPDNIPMECNPRLQNMNSNVAKEINNSLLEEVGLFHIFNRGITITAESLEVKGNTATIVINDTKTQGCIDGGHTYKAVISCKNVIAPNTQQVTIEVLSGAKVFDNFVKLAKARNRSQQVKDFSLVELENNFDWIKDIIKDEPFKVYYKENVKSKDIDIDVNHIIWMMAVVNPRFSDFVGKMRTTAALDNYIEYTKQFGMDMKQNPYYACKNILLDLIKMYDFIETHFGDGASKRLTRIKRSVKSGKYKTMFYKNTIGYKYPNQFIFPIFSSLRKMLIVDEETGEIKWRVEKPFELIKNILPDLAKNQLDYFFNNSQMLEACRFAESYRALNNIVINAVNELEMAEMKKELEKLKTKQN